jgi:hypothetical protein
MPPAIIQNGQGMISMESKNFEDPEDPEDVGRLNKDWSGVEVRLSALGQLQNYPSDSGACSLLSRDSEPSGTHFAQGRF